MLTLEAVSDRSSSSNHGNGEITSSHDKANTNHHLITTSPGSCDAYVTRNLFNPTISLSPKMTWHTPPPPLPLPIPNYSFNNQISVVQTAAVAAATVASGMYGASSTLPVTGSLQQPVTPAVSPSTFQLPLVSPREVAPAALRPAKRKRDESFISTSEPEGI